ncbi:MAG: polymorphic toxin-type HINT domain-containing protein [Chloroflexota bacterium]
MYGLARIKSGNSTWHQHDGLGSVRAVLDGAGAVQATTSYDPWGVPKAGSTDPFGFTGELHDGDLVHLRARWYHPSTGTFTARDPFAGFDTQPYSLHPYQYAYSNPVLWTDPSGRCVGWIWDDPTCEFIGWDRVQEGDLNWEDGRPWGGAALDFIPVVGDVKGLIEVFTGCDLVTGEDLGHWRWAGLLLMSEVRSVRHLDAVVTHADDMRHIPPHQGMSAGGARSDMAPEARTRVDELCFNSFSAETLVSTEDGLRPISEIVIGDWVWAYDEATDEHGLFPVTDVIVHTDPTQVHLLIDGELLETTPEHPFYTLERGWVDAGDLWVGAHIRKADGSYGMVQFLAVEREAQVMYNLTVDEAHTFFVGAQRWLVHNSGCPWPPNLSSINQELRAIAEKYENTPGADHKVKRYCDLCAQEMVELIQKLGYEADIVRFELPSFSGWIGTIDNRTVATNGWHDMVRINTSGQQPLFIDSEVFLRRGDPVQFEELTQFYQDADLFVMISQP